MLSDLISRVQETVVSLVERLPTGFSIRQSLGFSIALHIFIVAAVGTLRVSDHIREHAVTDNEIVFDLEIQAPDHANSAQQTASSTEELGKSNSEAEKESGRASNLLRGNMNREALLRASLTDLTTLTGSFEFAGHTVVSDSTGGFSLMDGDIPGSEFDSFGRRKGEGKGHGGSGISVSGGGFCPVPGGYR